MLKLYADNLGFGKVKCDKLSMYMFEIFQCVRHIDGFIVKTYSSSGNIIDLVLFDATPPDIPILLDHVICTGNETSLLQCSHNGFNKHNCNNHDDIVIACVGII